MWLVHTTPRSTLQPSVAAVPGLASWLHATLAMTTARRCFPGSQVSKKLNNSRGARSYRLPASFYRQPIFTTLSNATLIDRVISVLLNLIIVIIVQLM